MQNCFFPKGSRLLVIMNFPVALCLSPVFTPKLSASITDMVDFKRRTALFIKSHEEQHCSDSIEKGSLWLPGYRIIASFIFKLTIPATISGSGNTGVIKGERICRRIFYEYIRMVRSPYTLTIRFYSFRPRCCIRNLERYCSPGHHFVSEKLREMSVFFLAGHHTTFISGTFWCLLNLIRPAKHVLCQQAKHAHHASK